MMGAVMRTTGSPVLGDLVGSLAQDLPARALVILASNAGLLHFWPTAMSRAAASILESDSAVDTKAFS